MRSAMRGINVAVALVTLLSALAVLGSHMLQPEYRAYHPDSLGLVVAYAVVQGVIAVAFLRDTWLVPWLAVAKALAAYVFLWTFPVIGSRWIEMTPARYVYSLFSGEVVRLPMLAFVWLGRGAWNTFNAFYFTSDWWRPLRARQPLLGRVVTIVPIAIIVLCIWTFLELVRYEVKTFSPEAHEIARLVYDGLDCDTVRAHAGATTTDTRQRGERRWEVRISYGCAFTNVVVQGEDGRLGFTGGARRECCTDGSSGTARP
jgi:hypothetical protein